MAPTPPKPGWQQILQRGGAQLINTLLALGREIAEIFRIIKALFGNPTNQSIQAAIDRVRQAQIAGETATSGPPDEALPDNLIPRLPGMVSILPGQPDPGYRYFTIIPFKHPGEDELEYRTVVIDSVGPLTLQQIQQEALEQWLHQLESGRPSPRAGEVQNAEPGPPKVTMIFRQ